MTSEAIKRANAARSKKAYYDKRKGDAAWMAKRAEKAVAQRLRTKLKNAALEEPLGVTSSGSPSIANGGGTSDASNRSSLPQSLCPGDDLPFRSV